MNNKNKTLLSIIHKNYSFKIYLSFYISIKELNEINKNTKIISKYEEFKNIIDLNYPEVVKFLYFNKHYIHQILYEEEEIIFISSYENKKNLSYIFYLSLLIMENPNIINYSYKIDYIREINNEYKNIKDKYKSIVISKIILLLINNFDENKNEQELIKIKEEREEIIKSNIYIFKEMNLDLNEDYIKTKKIDEIYIEIINALIKSKKIDDYNYTYNIINQLDLENINITKTMFNKISKIFDSNDNYIITKIDDLNNENKINFYYIILKYILKDTIYIYQIPSLLKTRNLILKSLKSNQLLNINNNNNKYKFILHFLIDSDYYFQTIPDIDLNKLEEILNYYKENEFESKKEDIDIIQNIIKNKKGFYQKYLKDYDEYKNTNKKSSLMKINNENDDGKNKKEEINMDDIEKEKNLNKREKGIISSSITKEKKDNYLNKENNISTKDITKKKNGNIESSKELNLDLKNKQTSNSNNNSLEYFQKEYQKIKIIAQNKEITNNNNQEEYNKSNNNNEISNPFTRESYLQEKEKEKDRKEITQESTNNLNNTDPNINRNISFDNDIILKDIEQILKKSTFNININKKKEKNNNMIEKKEELYEEFSNSEDKYVFFLDENIIIKEKDLLKNNENIKFEKDDQNLIDSYNKLKDFIKVIKNKLKKEYEFELEIKLNFEESKEKSNGKYRNINCKYIIYSVGINKIEKNNLYQDEDILNKEKQENFDKLLSQLNFALSNINISTINKNTVSSNISETLIYYLTSQIGGKYEILDFVKKIGKHKEYGQFIIELSNGTFISSGKNSLYFYDKNNEKKKNELKIQNNYICELGNNNDEIKLAICSNNGIYDVLLKNDVKIETVFNSENDKNYRFCLNLKKTTIICTENGIFNIENLFGKILLENKYKINDKNYWGGIKINQNIVAFTSNEILPNGNDEIIIYNINSKNNIDIIKGCSFILSQDNLAIMSRKKTNNKILLCACKKYKKSQKNGILLLKLKIDNIVKIFERFYDTGNFEVYCFCPIIIREKSNNNIILDKKDYKVEDTKYFFVGGLDRNKKKGLIKLYQVKYKKPFKYTKIEYIQNIKPKKCIIDDSKHFNGFKGPITCIKQSLKQETILVTCLDGSVFLLTIPNIIGLKELNKNFNNLKNKK